jgi:hypothetical protein
MVAPGEGAEGLVASLRELADSVSPVAAEPVEASDGPSGIAAAISAYERQGERLRPAAALVHGSGDRSLAAVISLVKLEIPVARLAELPGEASGVDLAGLLADHTISPDAAVPEQIRSWLRRVLFA